MELIACSKYHACVKWYLRDMGCQSIIKYNNYVHIFAIDNMKLNNIHCSSSVQRDCL